VYGAIGDFPIATGHLDEGLAHTHGAARLDPLSVGPVHALAIAALMLQHKQYVDAVTFAAVHGALGEMDESRRRDRAARARQRG